MTSRPHSSDLFDVRREHQHRTHGGRVNFIQDCETCNAIQRLEEQFEAVRTAAIPVVNKLIEASNGAGLVVTKEELNALRDALASSPACVHEWVDASNEVVESGELCVKCHAIRAAPSPAKRPNE